jgi:hypothetical protein
MRGGGTLKQNPSSVHHQHQSPILSTKTGQLQVRSNEPLRVVTDRGPAQVAAAKLVAQMTPEEWVRLSAGAGAKGLRIYDWVRRSIRPLAEPDKGYWLLARRNIAQPEELAYYVCFGPQDTSLEELVRVAGMRWTIEESFEETKGEVGLDQYEVRRWVGWYRHITLALLAHAFLAATRAQAGAEKGEASL